MNRRTGFTLLELLVVFLILGVMMSMGILQYGEWRARSVAREAASLVMSELEKTRFEAKRLNQSRTVYIVPGATARSFQIRNAANSVLRTVQLPQGTVIPAVWQGLLRQTSPLSIRFLPPYGLVENFPSKLAVEIRLNQEATSRNTVELVSLLGKVILR